MDAGLLVDDAIVLGMIRERLARGDAQRGFILDGFPRNLAQATRSMRCSSEVGKPLDAVVLMEVDTASSSGASRAVAPAPTAAACSMSSPRPPPRRRASHAPRPARRTASCSARTTTRRQWRTGCRVYDEKTRPLVDFYRARGLLRAINAEGSVDEVTRRLAEALGAPALAQRRARGQHRAQAPARQAQRHGGTQAGAKPAKAKRTPGKAARTRRKSAAASRPKARGKRR